MQAFFPPDDLLSKSQGSTQTLPNGNVLVNWGSSGAVTEYLPNGTAIFHAYMDSGYLGIGVENYRAFRFNWTGIPNEEPALVVLKGEDGITAYVSWNGDTETKAWRFYSLTDDYGSKQFLGEVERTSFETSLRIDSDDITSVSAEAIGVKGKSLRVTGVALIEQEIRPVGTLPIYQAMTETTTQEVISEAGCRWEKYGILKYFRARIGTLSARS